jgi:hypothetical protein
MKCRILWFL